MEQHPEVEEARFWLFGDAAYAAFEQRWAPRPLESHRPLASGTLGDWSNG